MSERTHPSSISIDFDADSPADQVGKILIRAVLDAKHVLRDPPPDATVQAIRGPTASYCVSFYVADFADIPSAQTESLRQVLSRVANAGLRLARPQTDVFIVENSRPVTRSRQSPVAKSKARYERATR